MASDRTVVTELATALGTLPYPDVPSALATRPTALLVDEGAWERLTTLHGAGKHAEDFEVAFANGRAFAQAPDGLNGRPPRIVEWTGGRRPPGDEVAPIDLRIDHVYLVSCKYLSANVSNPSPARLFDGLLATMGSWGSTDWFCVVAPVEYQSLYDAARRATGLLGLPAGVADLTSLDRARLRTALTSSGSSDEVEAAYRSLSAAVAEASAERWRSNLRGVDASLMLWRLLRIGNAPYFLLGAHGRQSLRLRVATAWDWRNAYQLRDLSIEAVPAGQPKVEWVARYRLSASRETRTVRGHVEIRWSHGRFAQPPEAKIYVDTPIEQVPGYHPLREHSASLFAD